MDTQESAFLSATTGVKQSKKSLSKEIKNYDGLADLNND